MMFSSARLTAIALLIPVTVVAIAGCRVPVDQTCVSTIPAAATLAPGADDVAFGAWVDSLDGQVSYVAPYWYDSYGVARGSSAAEDGEICVFGNEDFIPV